MVIDRIISTAKKVTRYLAGPAREYSPRITFDPEKRRTVSSLALLFSGLGLSSCLDSTDRVEADATEETGSRSIPIPLGLPSTDWHKPGINLEVLSDGVRIRGTLENDSQGYGWDMIVDVPTTHPYLWIDIEDGTGSWGGSWGGNYMFALDLNGTRVAPINRTHNVDGFMEAGSGALVFDLVGLRINEVRSLFITTFAGTNIDLTLRNLRLSPTSEG
ncbi:hypothetical protein HZC35_03450 [Candidatus Saganbacteria bacterium]|nr:hypothetical protein [Candidatus Saganbacteria bacterium]